MVKRYVKISMPIEAYNNFKRKQEKMNLTMKELGHKKGIPLTRVITAISQKPIWFENEELAWKRKRGNGYSI